MQSYQHIKESLRIIWIISVEQHRIIKGLYQHILVNFLFSLSQHHFINNEKEN